MAAITADTATTAAPAGWHLPHDKEWTLLVYYAGGRNSTVSAGMKIQFTSYITKYRLPNLPFWLPL